MIRRAIKQAAAHVLCAAYLDLCWLYCWLRLAYYRIVIQHLTRTRPTHPDLTALYAHAFELECYLRRDDIPTVDLDSEGVA